MRFYLGTHEPSWLARTDAPLFISHRRLLRLKSYPQARGPWALDSGGFSELSMYGKWQTQPAEYARAVRRYRDEIGNLEWAAIQDWMCEPVMLKRTGLTIAEHQRRTVESYQTLTQLAPDLPWAPVLQGYTQDDYLRCLDLYERSGVDLFARPIVGVGTLCRRQATDEAAQLLTMLASLGLKLHGFGFKTEGLKRVASVLASSDSLAWSYNARRHPPLPGCTHKSCANCIKWAMRWRERLLALIEHHQDTAWQLSMPIFQMGQHRRAAAAIRAALS